jgi:hypothetical protein
MERITTYANTVFIHALEKIFTIDTYSNGALIHLNAYCTQKKAVL